MHNKNLMAVAVIAGIVIVGSSLFSASNKNISKVQNGAVVVKSQSKVQIQEISSGVTQLQLPSNARQIQNIPPCGGQALCVDLKVDGQDGPQYAPLMFALNQSVKVTWVSSGAIDCFPAGYMAVMSNNNGPKIWNFLGRYPDQNQFNTNNYPVIANAIPTQSSIPSSRYNLSTNGDVLIKGVFPWISPGDVGYIDISCTDSTYTNWVYDTVYIRNPL